MPFLCYYYHMPTPVMDRLQREATNFDVDGYIQSLTGTAIELGGPTVRDEGTGFAAYRVLNGIEPAAKLLVTNAYDRHAPSVDLLVDANNLPFDEGSVSMLLASYLPLKLWGGVMQQARRCLKENGVLITAGLIDEELHLPVNMGFTALRFIIDNEYEETGTTLWSGMYANTSNPRPLTYASKWVRQTK